MLSAYLFDKRHGRWSTISIILPPVETASVASSDSALQFMECARLNCNLPGLLSSARCRTITILYSRGRMSFDKNQL
jgi:hypothetical protein